MANSSGHPRARSERLLTSDVDGELVVYDLDTDEAHLLNGPLAAVWQLCDGSRSVEAIATAVADLGPKESLQVTRLAIKELQTAGLMAYSPPSAGELRVSRRDLLIKVGLGAAALPTIITLAAAPAMAAPCPATCNGTSDCQASGCISTGRTTCCPGSAPPAVRKTCQTSGGCN